jgi:hypothetical protein
LSPLNPHRLAELSTPFLRQLAEDPLLLAGPLPKNESKQDSWPPYAAEEAGEEEILRAVEEAVGAEEEEEEVEELLLLRSPRPRLKQLSHRQPTSELWGLHLESLMETEPKQTTSSMSSDTTIASTGGSLDSTPPCGRLH